MNNKTWRCFHCDEVFRSRKAAWAHFGDDRFCRKEVPACIDPLRYNEKRRITELREAQKYALDMQNEAHELSDRADGIQMELDEFKALTKCRNCHELRMSMDFAQGECLVARKLIEAVREKAPDIYAEIVG